MEHKSNVIKSKSSNNAITGKPEIRQDKKSRSNAEFQPSGLKKRGVYVEKKPEKLVVDSTGPNTLQSQNKVIRPPPRPRPGHKRFLSSVLTILSKSTTGTQYPDQTDSPEKNEKQKIRKKEPKQKLKYRSRVLNVGANAALMDEKLVVLKSKKDIVQTPSNYSEIESSKFSASKINEESNIIPDTYTEYCNQELVRQVFEGRKLNAEKKVKLEDPSTLVEKIKPKKEDKIYNFFIDLLETTLNDNVTKIEPNDAANLHSTLSSNIVLEIEESVAKKLNVKDYTAQINEDVTQKNQFKPIYSIRDSDTEFDDEKLINYFQSRPSSTKRSRENLTFKESRIPYKPKLKSRSYYIPRKIISPAYTENIVRPKRSLTKRATKKTIMNLFKEQLSMGLNSYEEPENLFEALRAIAKNKRKCQKSIHFELPNKQPRENNNDCMLKRRKIITPLKKNKKQEKYDNIKSTSSFLNSYRDSAKHFRLNKDKEGLKDDIGEYELEVYDQDVDAPVLNRSTYNEDLIYRSKGFAVPKQPMNISNALLHFTESEICTPRVEYSLKKSQY